jgi:CheY-like chemotaxis protein
MLPMLGRQQAPATVLVVEDDVLVRALLADALREAGLSVIEAARADEALSYFEAGGEADIVFSDVEMPGPLNGLQLAHRLRQDYPSLPIILTSGSLGTQQVRGVAQFVPKPFSLERAVALVLATLGRSQQGNK